MALCRSCGIVIDDSARFCPQCATPVVVPGHEDEASQHVGIPPLIAAAMTHGTLLFNKYKVDRLLGRGAMGVVFEGTDTFIGRRVAIKTVRFDTTGSHGESAHTAQRFLREAQAAGRLSHPNIVVIYEAGETHGMNFIVMELVDGDNLGVAIHRAGRLPPSRSLAIVSDIGRALGYAHGENVVHRDIKPGNILVRKDGIVKVTDFGIAKVVTDTSSLTRSGAVVGTPKYLSPEQIQGRVVDERSDLFSLAAVLFECLTGVPPFAGESVYSLIFQILQSPYAALDMGSAPATVAYREFFDRALAKDPNQRFPNAAAFVEALRHLPTELHGALEPRAIHEVRAARAIGDSTQAITSPEVARDAQQYVETTMIDTGETLRRRARKRSAVLAGVAASSAAVVLVAVLVGRMALRSSPSVQGSPAHEPTASMLAVEPPESQAGAGGVPAPVASATALERFVLPPSSPMPQSPAATSTRLPTRLPTPKPPAPSVPEVARAPVKVPTPVRQMGTIYVRVVPWAYVDLDGRELGEVPPADRFEVEAGTHTLRVRNSELGVDVEEIVFVRAGEETRQVYNLRKGFVTVRTTPSSNVYIGDRLVGATPVDRVDVPVGKHRLRLTQEGYREWIGQIDVAPLRELVIEQRLEQIR